MCVNKFDRTQCLVHHKLKVIVKLEISTLRQSFALTLGKIIKAFFLKKKVS